MSIRSKILPHTKPLITPKRQPMLRLHLRAGRPMPLIEPILIPTPLHVINPLLTLLNCQRRRLRLTRALSRTVFSRTITIRLTVTKVTPISLVPTRLNATFDAVSVSTLRIRTAPIGIMGALTTLSRITIVGPSAPTVEMFVGTTFVREPRLHVRQLLTGAGFGLIPKDRPHRAAIEILNPTTVADPREIVRLLGVTVPTHWRPAIVTRCSVPFGETYDQYIDIAVDVAAMSEGIAVMNGRRLPLPDPWHWRRNEKGKWTPDSAFVDACVARYKATHATHQDANAPQGEA